MGPLLFNPVMQWNFKIKYFALVFVELFHTEKTHMRNLKVMHRLFYQPMRSEQYQNYQDLAKLLFPNLDEIIQLHGECFKIYTILSHLGLAYVLIQIMSEIHFQEVQIWLTSNYVKMFCEITIVICKYIWGLALDNFHSHSDVKCCCSVKNVMI